MDELEVKTSGGLSVATLDVGPRYPTSIYRGVAVNDISEVHVGTQHVADKIGIALPKSDSEDISQLGKFAADKQHLVTKEDKSYIKKVTLLSFVLFVVITFTGIWINSHFSTYPDDTTKTPPPNESDSLDTTIPSQTEMKYSTFTPNITTKRETITFSTSVTSETKFTTVNQTSPQGLFCTNVQPVMPTITTPSLSEQSTFMNDSEYMSSTTMTSLSPEPIPCPYLDFQCKADFPDERYKTIVNASVVVVNVSRVADGVCFVRRSLWGSNPCETCEVFTPVSSIVIHFTYKCGTFSVCSSLMKEYEDDFVTAKTDFLYNFVIGGDCRIYEGVGWDLKGDKDNSFHVGVQLMNGIFLWRKTICDKQLYNLMLLVNVGRWCGKIKSSFNIYFEYDLNEKCNNECRDNFSSLKNILFLKLDKYFMNSDNYFIRDSIELGKMFPSCSGYVFQPCYTISTDPTCSSK